MRFRLGVVTGLGVGYYLGAKAGRQRYDQINRALRRVRRSDAFEAAADKARAKVEEGFEKARAAAEGKVEEARDLVESRIGDGHGGDVPPGPRG